MSTSISICVGIISLVCMIVFYMLLSSSVSKTVEQKSTENMFTALDGQANLIELFVSDAETIMKEYGSANELRELLKDPENEEKFAVAQKYTEDYFANLYQWEGVYLSTWETKVLAHSNAGAVGMVTRTGDALAPYQATMTSQPGGFFNGGAFVSPASKQLIFNLRMAIYDENRQPIGLVGGGPFLSGMNELLAKMKVQSFENAEYAVLDTANNIFAYHTDNTKIIQEIKEPALLEIMKKVSGSAKNGTYIDGNYTIAYQSMPEFNLMLTMKYETAKLMSDSAAIKSSVIIFVLIAVLVIILGTVIVLR